MDQVLLVGKFGVFGVSQRLTLPLVQIGCLIARLEHSFGLWRLGISASRQTVARAVLHFDIVRLNAIIGSMVNGEVDLCPVSLGSVLSLHLGLECLI